MESGWLLDDTQSQHCLGIASNGYLGFVKYTDPKAIRFAREADAALMKEGLDASGFDNITDYVKPVEHGWG